MARKSLLAALLLVLAWIVPQQAESQKPDVKRPKPAPKFEIEELGKKVFHVSFPEGERAKIKVRSSEDGDVDLYIEEMNGVEVEKDVADSKDCEIVFMPTKNKIYRLSVVNLGPGGNTCTLTHNGKEEKPDFGKIVQTKPVKIADEAKHSIEVKLQEGKWAAVWAIGEMATDIDVFVFDPEGEEVASDEHLSKDAFVSFLPKATGVYRIEVHNLGQGDNTCVVKHTTLEEAKKEKK